MPCFQPMRARRTEWTNPETGEYTTGVVIGNTGPDNSRWISLPCGKCIGCKAAHARAWALRCQLESQQHDSALFTTLTYNDETLPLTLDKTDLSGWLKRIRTAATRTQGPQAAQPLRFFACGEYGEQNHRPHYHAIVFGLRPETAHLLEEKWGKGFTTTIPATPATIAYTAGYAAKKLACINPLDQTIINPETGHSIKWQAPFLQMSRRPGIGGHARRWAQSWRLYAIHNGNKVPVPRFLHDAWKAQATITEQEELLIEKEQLAQQRNTSPQELNAQHEIKQAQLNIQRQKRKL